MYFSFENRWMEDTIDRLGFLVIGVIVVIGVLDGGHIYNSMILYFYIYFRHIEINFIKNYVYDVYYSFSI